MPYLTLQKVNGGPTTLRFRPQKDDGSWSKNYVQHKVGSSFWVDDEYVAYYLNYIHPCEDGVGKNVFTEPPASSKVQAQMQADQQTTVIGDLLTLLEAQGIDVEDIRAKLPTPSIESKTLKRVVRCASCNQKVSITSTQTDCPHCRMSLEGNTGGAITTSDLPSSQLTCPHEGCDFVTKPGVDATTALKIHIGRAHKE